MRILGLICVLFSATAVFAQDTILTMNGKKIPAQSVRLGGMEADALYFNAKQQETSIEMIDVFAVLNKAGDTVYAYQKDSMIIGREMTPAQMDAYIKGIQQSRKLRGGWLSLAGSGAAGLLAPTALNAAGLVLYWCPLVSFATVAVARISEPDIRFALYNSPVTGELLPYYLQGYREGVKDRRVMRAIMGSVAGLAAGITLYIVAHPSK